MTSGFSRRSVLALGGAAMLSASTSGFAQSGRVAKDWIGAIDDGRLGRLYGTEQKQAIELAFAEISAAGTLKDIKLEAIYADDGADRGADGQHLSSGSSGRTRLSLFSGRPCRTPPLQPTRLRNRPAFR